MDSFVDLRWVARAAERLMMLDPTLDLEDARVMARALALQPAYKVADPDQVATGTFEGGERHRRPAKRA